MLETISLGGQLDSCLDTVLAVDEEFDFDRVSVQIRSKQRVVQLHRQPNWIATSTSYEIIMRIAKIVTAVAKPVIKLLEFCGSAVLSGYPSVCGERLLAVRREQIPKLGFDAVFVRV